MRKMEVIAAATKSACDAGVHEPGLAKRAGCGVSHDVFMMFLFVFLVGSGEFTCFVFFSETS